MKGTRGPGRLVVTLAVLGCGGVLQAGAAQDRPGIDGLVARVGAQVAAFYERARQLVCTERSTVMPIAANFSADGFSRTVESELRVEISAADGDAVPDVRVTREILRINGREPREHDRTSRTGCTDPPPFSPEPLAFLLPPQRDDYTFKSAREGTLGDTPALIIDFESKRRFTNPELIEDEYGHHDCFDWKGTVPTNGRLWVEAATLDVIRLERRLAGPTDVRVPRALQQKYGLPQWVTIDRDDLVVSYQEVQFSDPHEVLRLPDSITSTTVLRTGLQSTRRTQVFSDYRRFLTGVRIRVR